MKPSGRAHSGADGQAARAQASAHPQARQLMSVRGIGPLGATALLAKQITPERFAHARQLSAYFGIVPDQHSSGPKVRLGKMSKRGESYVRSLLIEGAHALLRHVSPQSQHSDDRRLLRWIECHGHKGAAIRLANRNLRIVWTLLQDQRKRYCRQPDRPQQAAALQDSAMHP